MYSTPSASSASQIACPGLRSDTAPLHHTRRERFRGCRNLVERDAFVLAVRQLEVAGPVDDGGDALVLEERAVGGGAEVDGALRARRRDGAAAHGLVAARHRLHQL